jgi:hypothetical protein
LSIDVLQIGLITVISLFTWRIWRFTMRPLMVPHEPREVPYWVPCMSSYLIMTSM